MKTHAVLYTICYSMEREIGRHSDNKVIEFERLNIAWQHKSRQGKKSIFFLNFSWLENNVL
jgi:hypothetical protein